MKYPLILILLICLLSSGCRSKKAAMEKEERSLNELKQNRIDLKDKLDTKTEIFHISSLQSFSFEPEDSSQPSQIIYKNDTLNFKNARIRFDQQENSSLNRKQTSEETTKKDHSREESTETTKVRNRRTEVRAASWGLNFGIILGILVLIILGYLHYRTKL
jgi:hypothetical protein